MNTQKAYNEWSRTYDSDDNATRDLDQVVLKRVLGKLRFDAIIEAGCGTGKNTELLSRLGNTVHALDFSIGMLALAEEKNAYLDNVKFTVADITKRWPCDDESADLVTCNLILEHIEKLSPVFAEAARTLTADGLFFISELHPFRQYAGTVANFNRDEKTIKIPAFVHHVSDFIDAAHRNGFTLQTLQEWWHEKDENKPPRLVSFIFKKAAVK
jgi:ubiquinone/menaquinone biosynthesis C-methylase UbiE